MIHNAAFDMKFLNAELTAAGLPALPMSRATDTLMIARQKFPGSPASLDALCRRFGVDNSAREKHGALLDSEILAEVYLELIGGRQPDLTLNAASPTRRDDTRVTTWRPKPRPTPLPPRLTDDEAAAHAAFVAKLGDAAIWQSAPDAMQKAGPAGPARCLSFAKPLSSAQAPPVPSRPPRHFLPVQRQEIHACRCSAAGSHRPASRPK